ncbi:MAG: HlyD family efflux transporter periplasmic adaptor subunit [Pseudolabrys sp.]
MVLGVGILAGAWAIYFRAVTVQVAPVERDVAVQVFGLGTVEARVTSKIGFKVSGVLIDLRVDVGNRVPNGAILARLDDREQNARVARAQAAIEQTQANFQKASAGLEKAKANLANAKSISERRQQLVQSNSASVESAETAKTTLEVANAEVGLASSDIAVSRAAIGDAKAQQQLEAATLDFHTLAAPYDAMITARLKELGSALGAGEPVFTLIDPKSVWVMTYIDESKSGEIKAGDPAEIVVRSRPNQRFQGKVARIEPESDRVNEERKVAIVFDQLPADFHLGEQAEAYITTVRLAQPLLVPEAAITGLGKSRGSVWTVEDGRLQQHEAMLGHRLLDGRYEIIGGVPDKALVVSVLRSGLRTGRAAKTSDEPRK